MRCCNAVSWWATVDCFASPLSSSATEHPAVRDEAPVVFWLFLHHVKSSRFFGRAGPARNDGGGGAHGLAKGREQLSRVVTVRWYPALVSCGGENTKKGLRTLRPAVAFRGSCWSENPRLRYPCDLVTQHLQLWLHLYKKIANLHQMYH